ncbi:T9SS type B sorting domain-containing protein [Flavobacterium sp. GT3R68]|uniref:T9SS type B sorting domain-containing protein n=1 Tax=Flavobacterium sp. GT3R68 TaxID=2594437 RepID=UPI000F876284|nr:T9SS type B sorting domain-containing protein [Flavobacterium sp. GT3R68]RTY91799.1 T9SS type B sorting domain-containing protein [Flavobacterium sp. GSN2]TRW90139.1 T9SS type B sorting domain-containing protein [Flavobacterium sp. GT3R68]
MNKFIYTSLIIFFLSNWNLFSQTTLTHNVGNNVIPNTMYSCSWGGVCWARKFVLSDFGINSNQSFTINSGEVGLFYGINWGTNLQFNIYAVDSNFPASFSESNLIGSSQVVNIPVNININQIINVNFTNPVIVPAGTAAILVEVFQLHSSSSDAHAFVASTEFDNDFSWFRTKSSGCYPNTYVTTESLGRPDAKFYITINGQTTNIGPFNISVESDCNVFSKEFSLTNSSDISTISWNFGDTNSGTNNTSDSINPTHVFSSIGQYNVTAAVTNLSGQTYNINHLVKVLSPPIAHPVQPISICESTNNIAVFNTSNIQSTLLGNQTNMTVSYMDSNGNPLQSPLPNPLSSSTTTITARVAYSNNPNCYGETNISLIVNPKPIAHPISPIYSCDDNIDGIAIFNLSNVASNLLENQTGMVVTFYDGNGQTLPNPLPNLYTNTILNQEVITAKVTNPLTNCWAQTTFSLIVNTVNLPIVNSPQTFCIQQNSTLDSIAVSGQNIKWYNAVTGGNSLPNNTQLVNGTTYYASQTINNCESLRTTVLINIQNTPAPTGTAAQNFCSTQNATLSDIVVSGTNLNWYNSSSNTNVIPNISPLVNGATYYASQTINGCESVNRLEIAVTLINTLNAIDYSETICDDQNDSSEIVDLTSYNAYLISNPSNFTFEYYNSLSGATNQTNPDLITAITNYNITLGFNPIYVRIISNNGCHQIVKVNLTLVSKPIVNIPDIVRFCEKSAIIVDAGWGFDSYTWSTGSTLQAITISQAGNYSVTVTKNYGNIVCSTIKNFNVLLSNAATITNIELQDWTDTENIITVNTTGFGDYEFSIDGIHYQDSNVFFGLISGEYNVYVRDKNGCGIKKEEVFLLMYPKFFTPNGDGYNENWGIKFSFLEPGLKVTIFDRYGMFIKELSHTTSWDGKYNGNELPSTDYWFVVRRANGKEYKGHFTLKR